MGGDRIFNEALEAATRSPARLQVVTPRGPYDGHLLRDYRKECPQKKCLGES
jgi:hypothetical protein